MRVLIVKTSSLGDVVHTLPALNDLKKAHPDWQVDWLVEQAFADIVRASPWINEVITCEFRRWRKHGLLMFVRKDFNTFRKQLKRVRYDLIIDAQGLLKSAYLASLARGRLVGYDKHSAREALASFFYNQSYRIDKQQPAIVRTRQLFAQAGDYKFDPQGCWFFPENRTQVTEKSNKKDKGASKTLIFLHGTTWQSKRIPVPVWRHWAQWIAEHHPELQIQLFYGNAQEKQTAELIADGQPHCHVIPPQSLADIMQHFIQAQAVIAVDTGLAHLAAALDRPVLTFFGASDHRKTGVWQNTVRVDKTADYKGQQVSNIQSSESCSPCFKKRCPRTESGEALCMKSLSPQAIEDFLAAI